MKRVIIILFALLLLFFASTQIKAADTELLTTAWNFTANSGDVNKYQSIPTNSLNGKVSLRLTYNLKGKCILGGDASAIIFDQPVNQTWRYISLSSYGTNCHDGTQTVTIPLSAFTGLNTASAVGTFHARFWHSTPYNIDITSAVLVDAVQPSPSPSPTIAPTPSPSPSPSGSPIWDIRSVDSMKESKDRVCNQRDQAFIDSWIAKAVEIGANYVAVATPYENPTCGNAVAYGQLWADRVHAAGLKVWHRHMPLAHEGIYDTAKNNQDDYFDVISNYIQNNPTMFVSGDIFTPIPEPQNGGISNITYCGSLCQYDSQADFNRWIKSSMLVSELSFSKINKTGIKIGFFGFDGFVAWGHNNPDWNGILYNSTIARMGNQLAIDHYPEAVGTTMAADLDELHAIYPNVDIYISEWGTIGGSNIEQQVINSMGAAAARPYVKGFNYWHLGMGGGEALINGDFTNRAQFDEVQDYYTGN